MAMGFPEAGKSVLSPQERRERNRDEMRSNILDAARAVMRERGVAALSLREVARRVRLQAPSLYAYFPNKLALYDALFLVAVRLFKGYQAKEHAPDDPFWERLQGKWVGYMKFAQEQPDLYQLALERPVPGFVPSEESFAESRDQLAELEHMVREGMASGQITSNLSFTEIRDLLVAMCHGLTSQHVANEPDVPVGSGRYGSLIPAAVELFRVAWDPDLRPRHRPTPTARKARKGGARAN